MKHALLLLPALVLLAAGSAPRARAPGPRPEPAQQEQEPPRAAAEPAPPIVTLRGQVVDMACYWTKGALGGEHQACAEACVAAGSTVGFRTRERTYIVIDDPLFQKSRPDLSRFLNRDAEVTGSVHERDGIAGVKILTIEEVPS